MTSARWVPLLLLGLAVGGLAGAELVPATPQSTVGGPGVADPPAETSCLVVRAPGQLFAPEESVVTLLDGTRVGNATALGGAKGPVQVTVSDATLSRAPLVAIGSRQGLVWSECAPPSTSTYLQLPDVRSTDVVLVNPDSTDAVVNLTLHGARGEITESGTRGVAVPRRSTRVVPMSVLAPTGMPIGVEVRTSQGRILATARMSPAGGGADHAAGQEPEQQVTVAGVPAGATRVRLILSNPDADHLTATITVMGERGGFAPVGFETVEVEGRSSRVVDLTTAAGGDPVAIRVQANRGRVAASAHVQLGGDAALVPATAVGTTLVGYGPSGTLQLSNPGSEAVEVTVDDERITLAPAATWVGPVAAGRHEVSGGPVVAAVVSERGAAVRRLHEVGGRRPSGRVQVEPTLR